MNSIMKIVKKISIGELEDMASKMYGTLVKADVDIAKKIVIVDMEMHVDGEQKLLEQGSKQKDLWGINLKPDFYGTDEFIEFDSMINIRPLSNPTRNIKDENVRRQIIEIISEVVHG